MPRSIVPYGEEVGGPAGLSNYNSTIAPGIEEALRTRPVFTRYAAWNFSARVWFGEDERFHAEVWRYGSPVDVVSADGLADLMVRVSERWGYD